MTAVLIITVIALFAGLLLSLAARQLPASSDGIVEDINQLLPQTQCAQCGYPGCRPYASAIANDEAPINLCPPGGDSTIRQLADLLGRDALPLAEAPATDMKQNVAIIDEALCIGCTHCRDACPVDAIVGAHQFMHTIIKAECTGCELCVPRCPVDCISMVAAR
ncbi:MAG: electron transport complex subunit RsxB [Woeseia sp.]|nr:electron transport complex subunit RsxB [Woeseia sp.]MBT8095745.1 electron transport complex subunit RsxB [Woeseia sp.]NNE60317.1 electron transport complex subunit RsxB [Woeseia sp.]NNL55782.1 electron transport complex subunit RsxB [Woeseia sp.]